MAWIIREKFRPGADDDTCETFSELKLRGFKSTIVLPNVFINDRSLTDLDLIILNILWSILSNGATTSQIEDIATERCPAGIICGPNCVQRSLQNLYSKRIVEDIYLDIELHYVLTMMTKNNRNGCGNIDLTPYLDYKLVRPSKNAKYLMDIMTLGEFLDEISGSQVYESNKERMQE